MVVVAIVVGGTYKITTMTRSDPVIIILARERSEDLVNNTLCDSVTPSFTCSRSRLCQSELSSINTLRVSPELSLTARCTEHQ